MAQCAGVAARARLEKERDNLTEAQIADLEDLISVHDEPSQDPFNRDLVWPRCAADAARSHPLIQAALSIMGLMTVGPLRGWPGAYDPRVVHTVLTIRNWQNKGAL